MASRAQQKEAARQRRVAEEQARAERERRQRRLQMVLGVVIIAVVFVVVAIAISAGGSPKPPPKPDSPAARKAAAAVQGLLAGIPQSGNTLGSSSAPVTVTEFGDLECPVCREFALGAEVKLIQNDVRAGRVKLVFRSLCTATCNNHPESVFNTQQAAAVAAGNQQREWNYIELFYHEQGDETTDYVNDAYLNGLAVQIPGLSYGQWSSDRSSSSAGDQVSSDKTAASQQNFQDTPTVVVQGPKGAKTMGSTSSFGSSYYSSLEATIKQAA